jgi:hypothetical protein
VNPGAPPYTGSVLIQVPHVVESAAGRCRMANGNTYMIAANQTEFYEIEKSEDGTKVIFRQAGNPDRNFVLAGSAVGPLIKVLQKLAPYR